MQVTETLSEGLKREIKITVPATDLDSQLSSKLDEMRGQARIRGFRPGKVPVTHLKRLYGKSVMAEIIQETVNDSTQKVLDDRSEKPAYQPEIKLTEDQEEIERVMNGAADFEYTVSFEVLPEIELGDFSTIELERETVTIPDDEIKESIARLAEQNRPFTAKDAAAESGDRVSMDYLGKIDGEAFEGGADTDSDIVLGSNSFIPGFEDQLVGAKAGEERVLEVTFPDDYPAEHLAGKAATFDVTVKAVASPGEALEGDALAQTLGLEDLEKLRTVIRDQIENEIANHGRMKLKRELLDALDEAYSFELPPTLVEREFEVIWKQVEGDLEKAGKTFEDEDTTEEKAREDYQKIAERRVRLGLLLAEIGERNEIKLSDEEVNRALMARIRQFPGQEQQVFDFYQQNPGALAEIRAPLFEDKVIDFILELAKVTNKEVTREQLFTHDDHDHDHDHDHD